MLGRGFIFFLFSPRELGKWSSLTNIFFKWVVQPPTRVCCCSKLRFLHKKQGPRWKPPNNLRLFQHTFGTHPLTCTNRLQWDSFYSWRTGDCLGCAISGCVVIFLETNTSWNRVPHPSWKSFCQSGSTPTIGGFELWRAKFFTRQKQKKRKTSLKQQKTLKNDGLEDKPFFL